MQTCPSIVSKRSAFGLAMIPNDDEREEADDAEVEEVVLAGLDDTESDES